MYIPENSLAFHPEFDKGIKREGLIPLIDEMLFDLKKTARQDSNVHELIKASVPKATELAGLELDLAKQMTANFNKEAQKAFNNAMEEMQRRAAKKGLKQFTAKEADEFLGLLGPEFQDRDIGMQKRIAATMGAFYRFGRNTSLIGKVGFVPSFNLIDRQAQKFLERDTLFWIGEHYNSGISNVVRETALNDMVLSGLGRKEAGKQLERNFTEYLKNGTIPAGVTVPSGWTGSTQDYFTGLVANARNKATTYSRIFTYQQAGVETYEIVAVIDRRTSEICQFMNGKIFNVSWAADTVQEVITAKTPEETKDVIGWKRAPDAMAIAGITNPNQKLTADQSFALHEAGLDLPPYHFRCRTTVVASSESELIVTDEERGVEQAPLLERETKHERRLRLRRENRARKKEAERVRTSKPEPIPPKKEKPKRPLKSPLIEGETKHDRKLRLRRERRARIKAEGGRSEVVPKKGKVPKKPKPPPTVVPESRRFKGEDPKTLRFKTKNELDTIYANQVKEFNLATKGLFGEEWQDAFDSKMNDLINRSGGLAKGVRGISGSGKPRKTKAWKNGLISNKHGTKLELEVKAKNLEKKLSQYWTVSADDTVVIDDIKIVPRERFSRASYKRSEKTMFLPSDSSVLSTVHEFSHHLEHSNLETLQSEARRFLNGRTRGDKAVKLNDLFSSSGYKDSEIIRKDKFFSPYCGKVYASGSTEIISMGMEEFIKNPGKFYKQDPDHFSLILGILRGEVTAPVLK